MSGKRANGEGSVYQRADGVWLGAAYVDTTDGQRRRVYVSGLTRAKASEKLNAKIELNNRGVRAPAKQWTVADYLEYWLKEVVAVKNRARTIELYEQTVRVHLKPAIGRRRLSKLTVQDIQRMINHQAAAGIGARTIQKNRSVLRAALSRAEREELVVRNVAKAVDLPAYQRKPITPWTAQQVIQFLAAARSHRLFGAYLLLLTYGLRRGEVLGLRWQDVDFNHGQIRIEQQLQRIRGDLVAANVKTAAGNRLLPLIPLVRVTLLEIYDEVDDHDGLVFRSTVGGAIDPKSFVRTFHWLREQAGLPRITVHHTRHTAATLLKNLGVPARDAQLILGHAHITTTQQLYQHADIDGQKRALERMGQLLTGDVAEVVADFGRLSTGQGAKIGALTSGGSSGLRTRDTLLKRPFSTPVETLLTPVISHVRTRANTYILGWVAAHVAEQAGNRAHLAEAVEILHLARHRPDTLLHLDCYPYNLLPTRIAR